MRNKDSGKLIKASNNSTRISQSGRTVKDRTGEVRMMSCGQTATIIAYRSNRDVDVQFEDGTVILNKGYRQFQLGGIKHPNCKINTFGQVVQNMRNERVGESKEMRNGMFATIIAYHNQRNIDVQFEDDTIVKGVRYHSWTKGEVRHPNNHGGRKEIRWRVNMMNCGFAATIIDARTANDIDVQFEDGTIVKHKSHRAFKMGQIAYPDKDNRLGETRMMNCGMECTIIAYITNRNIVVKFTDGTRVANKSYSSFKSGSIQNPNMKRNRKKRNNKEQQREKTTRI